VFLRGYILFLICCTLIFPQQNFDSYKNYKNSSFSNTIKNDALESFNISLNLLQSPLHFDNNDMIMAGIVLTMTGAAFSVDNKIRTDVSKIQSKSFDDITYYGEKFGRPVYASILSGLLYTTGYFISDDYIKETGQILAETMICTGLLTQLLKITLGRARPFTGSPNTDIDPFEFEFESEDNSLPSGHTSIAFSIATVLSQRINNPYVSFALYSMASLTAYQRIYSDDHWLSDTILGAALGTFIGLKIVKLHENNSPEEQRFSLNVFPQINPRSYGVGFALQF